MRPRERRISVPARQPSAPPGRARSAPPGCGGLRIPRVAILLPAGRAHPLWECMALRSRLIPTARALPVLRSGVPNGGGPRDAGGMRAGPRGAWLTACRGAVERESRTGNLEGHTHSGFSRKEPRDTRRYLPDHLGTLPRSLPVQVWSLSHALETRTATPLARPRASDVGRRHSAQGAQPAARSRPLATCCARYAETWSTGPTWLSRDGRPAGIAFRRRRVYTRRESPLRNHTNTYYTTV